MSTPPSLPRGVVVSRWLFLGLSLAMVYLVIVTSIQSNLFQVSLAEPWFRTTLWDFYFNITILAAWVIYKENNRLSALLWVLAFIFLGSVATCFYVFLQLLKLRPGDPVSRALVRS